MCPEVIVGQQKRPDIIMVTTYQRGYERPLIAHMAPPRTTHGPYRRSSFRSGANPNRVRIRGPSGGLMSESCHNRMIEPVAVGGPGVEIVKVPD